MKNSCITYPERDPLVVIRKSQVEFCDGNVCAAALLSFFEYWHNVKLEMVPKAAALNVVAEAHGKEGCHDDSLYQFHKMEELSNGMMGLYGRDTIKMARALLKEKGVITEHRNPTKRYKFDNTVYYLFHPETVCEWLSTRYNLNQSYRHAKNSASIQPEPVISIPLKIVDGPTENRGWSDGKPSIYSTEITSEITSESGKEKEKEKPASDYSAKMFDAFYAAYPKKEKRIEAEKAWKKINPDLYEMIIADVINRAMNHEGWKDKKYITAPPVYLNQQLWTDEIRSYHSSTKELKPEAWDDMTCFDGLDGNGQPRQEKVINPIKGLGHEHH